MQDTFTTANT